MIHTCTCQHEFQDKRYGKGQRVFNPMAVKNQGQYPYKCTVCEKVIYLGEKEAKK